MKIQKVFLLFICIYIFMMLVYRIRPANADGTVNNSANSANKIHKIPKVETEAKIISKTKQLKKKVFKSPFSESIITKKEIKAVKNPMTGVAPVLSTQPSISAQSFGPNNLEMHIEMRGFNRGQITQSFDGVPLNSLFTSFTEYYNYFGNLFQIPLGDISFINIYRGINKPRVNSFDSLGGTIDYNPVMPSNKANGAMLGGYGSYDTRNYGFYLNTGKLPGGIRMYIRATRNISNGWMQNQNNEDSNNSYYIALIKPYNEDRSNVSLIYLRNDNSGYNPFYIPLPLQQKYGYTFGWPSSISNQYNIHENYYLILGWKNYVNKHFSFSNKAFYYNFRSYLTSYANPQCVTSQYSPNNGICNEIAINGQQPFLLPTQPYTKWFTSGSITYNPVALFGSSLNGTDYHLTKVSEDEVGDISKFNVKLPYNKITFGAQFLFGNNFTGQYIYGSSNVPADENGTYNDVWELHGTAGNNALYIQDKIQLLNNRLDIEPGLKYVNADTIGAYNTAQFYKYSGTVSNIYNYMEPSIGINYKLLKNWIVYGAWGKTEKIPELEYYPIQVSAGSYNLPTTVNPEYITDYELGTRYKYAGLQLSLNGYKELFENTFNFATYPQYGNITVEYNSGSSFYEGVEFALSYQIDKYAGVFENWSYNTAIYTTTYNGNYGTVYAGDHIANVPRHLANIGFNAHILRSRFRIWGTYTGQVAINNLNGTPSGTNYGGYWIFNGYLSHYFNFDKMGGVIKKMRLKGVTLSLNIDNILNKQYNAYLLENSTTLNNGSTYNYLTGLPGLPRFAMLTGTFKF